MDKEENSLSKQSSPKKEYNKIKISLLLLGETGDGKSQLGNFILNNPKAFKVSDDIYPETKETKGDFGINGAENLFVIDTPGINDTEGKDKEYLEQMAEYVKKHNSLHSIIIVLNFEVDRLAIYLQDMLKIFIKMFPIPNFWDHVGFVFTHYYSAMKKKNEAKKNLKIEKFSEMIIDLMNNLKKIVKDIIIPKRNNLRFYFVDTEMESIEDKDEHSIEEINRLIGWASSLETFETDKVKKVDNKVIHTKYETRKIKTNSKWNKNVEIINYIEEKRKVETLYCGKISYNPWKEVHKYSKEVVHKPKVIKTDTKWIMDKTSIMIGNIEKIIINYFYKKIKIYNNDTTNKSLWIFIHSEKYELTHPKAIIKAETEYKTTNDSWTNNSGTLVIHYTYMWSRLKKTYNDNSVEYSDWTKINTIKKEEKKSPKIIDTKYETKVTKHSEPITSKDSKKVLDFYFIIPVYKTIESNKIIGEKITETIYERKVTYFSDGTIDYGEWLYKSEKVYNKYF
jgi:predicted GTPase